jgi:hypothetical protein
MPKALPGELKNVTPKPELTNTLTAAQLRAERILAVYRDDLAILIDETKSPEQRRQALVRLLNQAAKTFGCATNRYIETGKVSQQKSWF